MATCPECDYDEVDTEEMEEGDTISCPECGKSLVVTGADEVEVAADDDDLDDEDEEEEEEEEEEDDDEDLDEEEDTEDEEDLE
jgi:alpha-aminoadipate carrier protein LysW